MPSQIYLFFISYELKEAELEEVACVSAEARSRSKIEVLNICATHVKDIKHDEWVDAYLYLKQRIDGSM